MTRGVETHGNTAGTNRHEDIGEAKLNTREETVKIKLETPRLKLKYAVRHMAGREESTGEQD